MFFRKKSKTDVQKLIDAKGMDAVVHGFTGVISEKLPNYAIAYQFVLEEIEAASKGSEAAIRFAENSGVNPREYNGALDNSIPEVDGPSGPQQTIIGICSQLISDPDLMVELRVRITDNIMRKYSIGKYERSETDDVSDVQNDMYSEDIGDYLTPIARSLKSEGFDFARAIEFGAELHYSIENKEHGIKTPSRIFHKLSIDKFSEGDDRQKTNDFLVELAIQFFGFRKHLQKTLPEFNKLRYSVHAERHDILFRFSDSEASEQLDMIYKGGMRLEDSEVDILFIAKNDRVIYINDEAGHLFTHDSGGGKKLEGRVVRFVFVGQNENSIIEVFVAFDDHDSYSMFTARINRDERLGFVCQSIFKHLGKNIINVFSATERYSTEFEYTFKLYEKDNIYIMVNKGRTQGYLIDGCNIRRDDVEKLISAFFNDEISDQNISVNEHLSQDNGDEVSGGDAWIDELIDWAESTGIPDRPEIAQTDNILDPVNLAFMTSVPGFPRSREALQSISQIKRYHLDSDYHLAINLNGLDILKLPDSFCMLVGIHTLYLHTCGLSDLPECIGRLKYMDNLDLGGNHLRWLPESLGELRYLKYINLNNNDLIELPESFIELSCLETLQIAGNDKLTLSGLQHQWLKEFQMRGGELQV